MPDHWPAYVHAALSPKELARLRLSVGRGQPFGQDPWLAQTAAALGLEHTLRREGRPRKDGKEPQ